jgi:hypothetical protein
MSSPWISAAGWLGAGLTLVAYVLVSARKLEGHGAGFQALNLFGSIGLAASSAAVGALPSVAANLIWMAIGVFALVRRPGRTRDQLSMS